MHKRIAPIAVTKATNLPGIKKGWNWSEYASDDRSDACTKEVVCPQSKWR